MYVCMYVCGNPTVTAKHTLNFFSRESAENYRRLIFVY